ASAFAVLAFVAAAAAAAVAMRAGLVRCLDLPLATRRPGKQSEKAGCVSSNTPRWHCFNNVSNQAIFPQYCIHFGISSRQVAFGDRRTGGNQQARNARVIAPAFVAITDAVSKPACRSSVELRVLDRKRRAVTQKQLHDIGVALPTGPVKTS